nr:histone deacetylase 14 [Tanacetum cinerariifolium]
GCLFELGKVGRVVESDWRGGGVEWFVLTKDTLREALQITPINNNQAFVAPLSSNRLINFVNELGYPKLEEFIQSIHTFIEDKRNLSRHTSRKKRATLIVIPSIRFTKMIIHHLQRRHRFHPRPDSLLHLPNEEPILGYLKFSAKGTKREVFGMPIPGSLITAEIQEASYYQEYLLKVAQHRRYLAGETEGDQDPPASKPTQPARKPKTTTTKAPPRPAVTSTQPAPTSAPAKPQEKKAEDVPIMEPQGPLPPVDIKEPESGKYQLLLEVPGKGKAKVIEEQSDSEEESEKVVIGATEEGKDEDQLDQTLVHKLKARRDQTLVLKMKARLDQTLMKLLKARLDQTLVQSIPSPVVHAGLDRKHMDLDVADVSPQPFKEQLDEGFTVTAYPKVQENLKLAVEEQVLFEDPASSSGTISSL